MIEVSLTEARRGRKTRCLRLPAASEAGTESDSEVGGTVVVDTDANASAFARREAPTSMSVTAPNACHLVREDGRQLLRLEHLQQTARHNRSPVKKSVVLLP